MKRLFLSCAALGALAAAAPAAAQYANVNAGGAVGFENRISQLSARLDAEIRSGAIDRTEATTLRRQLRDLSRLERQYSRNGLTAAERTDLQARLRDLREDIRLASGASVNSDRYGARDDMAVRYDRNGNRDVNGQYDRSGNWIGAGVDTTVRYDRYGNRDVNGQYDRNGNLLANVNANSSVRYDRYDRYGRRDDVNGEYDRNGNRIGRADDGYYGQGGPYEADDQVDCRSRGGLGGVLDNVLGRDTCGGTLRVGERVTGGLSAVPTEYRYRYRDGNGVYYRSDGRSIYQIDARTDVVLRIYPMDR